MATILVSTFQQYFLEEATADCFVLAMHSEGIWTGLEWLCPTHSILLSVQDTGQSVAALTACPSTTGDVKLLPDDLMALKPTIFVGVPRVFDRIYTGAMAQVTKAGKSEFAICQTLLVARLQRIDCYVVSAALLFRHLRSGAANHHCYAIVAQNQTSIQLDHLEYKSLHMAH